MLLGKYLLLLIFPYQQVCDYSFNQLPLVGFGSWQTLLSLLIYVALIIYAIRSLRKKSPVAYGIFFFIITMSIYSNLVYLIGSSFADRFLFIPSLGYCMAIVYLLYQYADKKKAHNKLHISLHRV
jgi:NADH:ubiquinone oxidoreductase subunit 6 (subunit J)